MLRPLSQKQRELLDLIIAMTKARGYAPTFQELGDRVGRTKAVVFEHVDQLRKKGWLLRPGDEGVKGTARSFTLSSEAKAELGFGSIVEQLQRECRLLAMLAAPTPQFDNPLMVFEAEKIRDKWLAPQAVPA
jgi:SOS-response transcriptional repressor LexA